MNQMLPRLYTVDEVIENVFAGRRDRRSLIENLRDGGKFAGCARKDGQAWVFTDDDIRALLDRMKPAPVDYGPTARGCQMVCVSVRGESWKELEL